jgi:hypothetical protein
LDSFFGFAFFPGVSPLLNQRPADCHTKPLSLAKVKPAPSSELQRSDLRVSALREGYGWMSPA